ncbi:MAG: hypothetical protein WC810_03000 [Janthinobacterium sp.]|jgi:hypothetical protein
MTRSEIITRFRTECPEIPSNVISDTILNSWLLEGDHQFCAETRCIVDQDGTQITTVENDLFWDLTAQITSFFDVDTYPASGVLYNDVPLKASSLAELDALDKNWRSWPNGTPQRWYRRGKYLYLDRPIDTNAYKLKIYSVLKSTDWSTDVAPFNQLTYLEPYHYAMVLYLIKRAKAKIAKPEDSVKALAEYGAYVTWVKSQLGANKYAPIYFSKRVGT